MAEGPKNMFWDMIAGRAPLPAVLGLLGWNAAQGEPGHVRAGFQGQETFYNPVGLVQGGILSAMLDGVMGAAAVSLLGADESIATLEMKTNYMRSVKDVPLVGEGRVVHRGGSVIFMEGSITTEDGSLVATATATGRVIRAAGGSAR